MLLRSTAHLPSRISFAGAALTLAVGLSSACSDSDKTTSTPAACPALASGSGPVSGPADDHCGTTVTHIGTCITGEVPDAGGGDVEEPFEVRYGTSAMDDDCKYQTSFTIDCATHGNFSGSVVLTLQNLEDQSFVDGADATAEVYLSDTHISPGHPVTTPLGNGQYRISGVQFDEAGRWTIRFHFFESCNDAAEDSPHGHVAYYVDVL